MRCSEGGWSYVATCLPGSQNSHIISIKVNGNIEINISKLHNLNNNVIATDNINSNNDIASIHIKESHININIPINNENSDNTIISNNDAIVFPNDYNKLITNKNKNKPRKVTYYDNSYIDELNWRMGSEVSNYDIRK